MMGPDAGRDGGDNMKKQERSKQRETGREVLKKKKKKREKHRLKRTRSGAPATQITSLARLTQMKTYVIKTHHHNQL